jgi:hypothetical protein
LSVSVKYKKCGTIVEDNAPAFVVLTQEYVARRQTCPTCPATTAQLKNGRKTGLEWFIPVSDELNRVTDDKLGKQHRPANPAVEGRALKRPKT